MESSSSIQELTPEFLQEYPVFSGKGKQRMKPNGKNSEISYQLGRRVADLRHRAGICQEKLAKILGLGQPSSISNREQGITDFTPWELSQLSRHFGVTVDFLVLGKTEKTTSDETSKIVQQIGNLARECTLDRLVMLLHLAQSAAEASRNEISREKEQEKTGSMNSEQVDGKLPTLR
jgi:transcriptional regulator with XRE-family HTH domain